MPIPKSCLILLVLTATACKDHSLADALDEQCAHRSLEACCTEAEMYGSGLGVDRDPARAEQILKAMTGFGASEASRCEFFLDDVVRPMCARDAGPPGACERLRGKGCSGGPLSDCVRKASDLWDGRGISIDRQAAAQMYLDACGRGSALACSSRGLAHLVGEGVLRSRPVSRVFLKRACRLGEETACSMETNFEKDDASK